MDEQRREDLLALSRRIEYQFSDLTRLDQALCHSSFAHESPACEQSNERLEFLGDAVLELIVTEALFGTFDDATEGQLSRARSSVVNELRLAEAARQVALGECMQLGRGERNQGGGEKNSILADALEAVIAAVYLDGGLEAAREVILGIMGPLEDVPVHRPRRRDYKTRLQERVQDKLRVTPRYRTVGEEGPDHDKTFRVNIEVGGRVLAQGEGRSKKEAEQNAAKEGLHRWEEHNGELV